MEKLCCNLTLCACLAHISLWQLVSHLTGKGIGGPEIDSQTQEIVNEPIAYSCASKKTGHPQHRSAHGLPAVLRCTCYRLEAFGLLSWPWPQAHGRAKSATDTGALLCFAAGQVHSSKKLRHRRSGDLTSPGGEQLRFPGHRLHGVFARIHSSRSEGVTSSSHSMGSRGFSIARLNMSLRSDKTGKTMEAADVSSSSRIKGKVKNDPARAKSPKAGRREATRAGGWPCTKRPVRYVGD